MKQAFRHREGLDDDPLTFAISLSSAAKTPMGLYITRLLDEEEYEQSGMIGLQEAVCSLTLCQCGSIPTEGHIIVDCGLSRTIRDRNPRMVFALPEFFFGTTQVMMFVSGV